MQSRSVEYAVAAKPVKIFKGLHISTERAIIRCLLTPMPEISELGFNTHGAVVQLRPAVLELIPLCRRRPADAVEAKSVFRSHERSMRI